MKGRRGSGRVGKEEGEGMIAHAPIPRTVFALRNKLTLTKERMFFAPRMPSVRANVVEWENKSSPPPPVVSAFATEMRRAPSMRSEAFTCAAAAANAPASITLSNSSRSSSAGGPSNSSSPWRIISSFKLTTQDTTSRFVHVLTASPPTLRAFEVAGRSGVEGVRSTTPVS